MLVLSQLLLLLQYTTQQHDSNAIGVEVGTVAVTTMLH